MIFPPTLILRHRKENLNKCSLRGLETRPDMRFYTYPWKEPQPDLSNYVLLGFEGPLLSSEDKDKGIFLIDSTWRNLGKMIKSVKPPYQMRSLPLLRTAYPRTQEPEHGLASIEALYLAYTLLGRDATALLDHYYWKELFLANFNEKRSDIIGGALL